MSSAHPTQINAPIRGRCFHDAHLWLILWLFFIAIALPFQWHTVAAWAFVFCLAGLLQRTGIKFALKSLALAFGLSISIWILNRLYHAPELTPEQVLAQANRIGFKIWALTWVALLSAKMVNLRDVITSGLQRRYLSSTIAYATLVGIGAITLLRAESSRISLNAKLRGLSAKQRFLQWLPLLIFAIRHAQRGAMSLRARGLGQNKAFYYNYQATRSQRVRALLLLVALIGVGFFSEMFFSHRLSKYM